MWNEKPESKVTEASSISLSKRTGYLNSTQVKTVGTWTSPEVDKTSDHIRWLNLVMPWQTGKPSWCPRLSVNRAKPNLPSWIKCTTPGTSLSPWTEQWHWGSKSFIASYQQQNNSDRWSTEICGMSQGQDDHDDLPEELQKLVHEASSTLSMTS